VRPCVEPAVNLKERSVDLALGDRGRPVGEVGVLLGWCIVGADGGDILCDGADLVG
jgi:hypothetical protein